MKESIVSTITAIIWLGGIFGSYFYGLNSAKLETYELEVHESMISPDVIELLKPSGCVTLIQWNSDGPPITVCDAMEMDKRGWRYTKEEVKTRIEERKDVR